MSDRFNPWQHPKGQLSKAFARAKEAATDPLPVHRHTAQNMFIEMALYTPHLIPHIVAIQEIIAAHDPDAAIRSYAQTSLGLLTKQREDFSVSNSAPEHNGIAYMKARIDALPDPSAPRVPRKTGKILQFRRPN